MNDSWPDIVDRAGRQLPSYFSSGVLARVQRERRAIRETRVTVATLALCASLTAGLWAWQVHREHEQNLAQWRELSAITVALNQL